MHEFCAGHRHFGTPDPEDRLMGMPPAENERAVHLSNLLDALGDPAHEQQDKLQDWVGDNYDPDVLSINDVNRMLTPLRRLRGNDS